MFSALLVTTAAIAVGGGFLALLVGVQAGVDLFWGGIVVILPQGWLAYQLGPSDGAGSPRFWPSPSTPSWEQDLQLFLH